MIIVHVVNGSLKPRHASATLKDRLRVMPAVVLGGARQTGKSTLAEGEPERQYRSLDDLDVLDLARRDPMALVSGSDPVTLDEVQRRHGGLRPFPVLAGVEGDLKLACHRPPAELHQVRWRLAGRRLTRFGQFVASDWRSGFRRVRITGEPFSRGFQCAERRSSP